MIGGRVVRLASVASTNDVAARLAAEGAAEGTVVVADEQYAGRGRQGRPWHAAPGDTLCCSIILRPGRPVREWPDLSWVLAAGVAAFAREAGAAGASVKHPNDVLVGGRKLAGLLLESRTGCDGPSALICGIGLNLNADPAGFPPELRATATSLHVHAGRRQDRDALLPRLFEHLDRWYRLWLRDGAAGALERLDADGLGAADGPAAHVAARASAGCGAGEGR